jgi:glycosyltransferase involved in cell wall biosynthesis
METEVRIAVVADAAIGSGLSFPNGFSHRYDLVVRHLARSGHEVLVISPPDPDGSSDIEYEVVPGADITHVRVVDGPDGWATRHLPDRITTLARIYSRSPGLTGWERAASRAVRDWSPDVLLALTPFNPILATLGPHHVPVAFFAEEDLAPLKRIRPAKRPRPRWKQWLRIRLRPTPDLVITISAAEEPWAREQYPRSPVLTVPHVVDLAYWSPGACEPDPEAPEILCVGHFESRRNHVGLERVARCLASDAGQPNQPLTVGVASVLPPPDAVLQDHGSFLRYLGAVEDLRPLYRGATLSLVPAFTVTGVKTQILQAWAMGCPVVTTEAGRASVGGEHGVDLVAGHTPEEVAGLVASVASDPDLAATLAANGLDRVRRDFSEAASATGIDQMLRTLVSGSSR